MKRYQPRNILVTGGAGFIGANFIRYLLQHEPDMNIVNLDKLTYAGNLLHLKDLTSATRYRFIHGDIKDRRLVDSILTNHDIDTIVHFAAESHVDRSIVTPHTFVETNVLGTAVLLEAARQYWLQSRQLHADACRFHHISTDEVYGSLECGDEPFTETTAYAPRSPYSATKAASDHLVSAYWATYGLPMTLSNCSNNYGPYQHPEKFIPTIIRACLKKQAIPIYGNGKNIRDWLYVEDHCRGIVLILKNGRIGENYNLGGRDEWENIALARAICKQIDLLLPTKNSHIELLQYVTDRAGHDFRYAINIDKIQKELNWSPHENFATGIRKTIAFYLEEKNTAEIAALVRY